jgi:hypothetical protein
MPNARGEGFGRRANRSTTHKGPEKLVLRTTKGVHKELLTKGVHKELLTKGVLEY